MSTETRRASRSAWSGWSERASAIATLPPLNPSAGTKTATLRRSRRSRNEHRVPNENDVSQLVVDQIARDVARHRRVVGRLDVRAAAVVAQVLARQRRARTCARTRQWTDRPVDLDSALPSDRQFWLDPNRPCSMTRLPLPDGSGGSCRSNARSTADCVDAERRASSLRGARMERHVARDPAGRRKARRASELGIAPTAECRRRTSFGRQGLGGLRREGCSREREQDNSPISSSPPCQCAHSRLERVTARSGAP